MMTIAPPEKPANKFLANHIRAELCKGWPPNSRFVSIVKALPDDEIIRQKREHDEHQALLVMYKSRAATAKKPEVSQFDRLAKACLKVSAVVLFALLMAVPGFAAKNKGDFPLTGTLLSIANSTSGTAIGSIMNPSTGHIVGTAVTISRTDDQEAVQIGNLLYITRIAGHAGKAIRNHRLKPLEGKAGQSFPAQLEGDKRINLLVDGNVVHLEIVGEQAAQ
jgi:hypothetical protein